SPLISTYDGCWSARNGARKARATVVSNKTRPTTASRFFRNRKREYFSSAMRAACSSRKRRTRFSVSVSTTTARAISRTSQADLRVQGGVEDVHNQVRGHVEHGDQEHVSEEVGESARARGLEEVLADPIPTKNRLDVHVSCEGGANREAGNGQCGRRRVPKRMCEDDVFLRHALGSCRSHVILAEDLEHPRSGDTQDDRELREAQSERRKDEVREGRNKRPGIEVQDCIERVESRDGRGRGRVQAAIEGKDIQVDRCEAFVEKDLEHDPEPIHRDGDAKDGDESGCMVSPAVTACR